MVDSEVVENWSAVGDAIRARMMQLGISQAQLITRSGVPKQIVEAIVCGEIPPSVPRQANPKTVTNVDALRTIEARLLKIERFLIDLDRRLNG